MSIEEIKQQKKELESEVTRLVSDFEHHCGIEVSSLSVGRKDVTTKEGQIICDVVHVYVECKI